MSLHSLIAHSHLTSIATQIRWCQCSNDNNTDQCNIPDRLKKSKTITQCKSRVDPQIQGWWKQRVAEQLYAVNFTFRCKNETVVRMWDAVHSWCPVPRSLRCASELAWFRLPCPSSSEIIFSGNYYYIHELASERASALPFHLPTPLLPDFVRLCKNYGPRFGNWLSQRQLNFVHCVYDQMSA